MSDTHPLVGAWRVTVSIPGVDAELVNLAAVNADGGVVVAFPSPSPAPPGAGHHLEFWTPAIGAWTDAGAAAATLSFVSLGTDENGASIGSHVVSATVEIDADGASWHGPFVIEIIGVDGAAGGAISGSVVAARIQASPAPITAPSTTA